MKKPIHTMNLMGSSRKIKSIQSKPALWDDPSGVGGERATINKIKT
jgi:hypothetical protein